jgi:hypothetical protein
MNKIEEKILKSISAHDSDTALRLLKNIKLTSKKKSFFIHLATIHNCNDIIKLLLKDINIMPCNHLNLSLNSAVLCQNMEIVKLLLSDPRVDPSNDSNGNIQCASESGNFLIVELLLKDSRVNPADNDNYAISEANEKEYTEIVKLLWQNNKVKSSLKNDDLVLYNELTAQDIKNKICSF